MKDIKGQLSLFDYLDNSYKITKPIRLIELFGGYGSQLMALKRIGADVTPYKLSEWNTYATKAWNSIHGTDRTDYAADFSKEELVDTLYDLGVSLDGKTPVDKKTLSRKNISWLQSTFNDFKQSNNIGSLCNFHADALNICDTEHFEYIMTYSFPCQDLSVAGKQRGMEKGSGTRSGLLWEVERLLQESVHEDLELPQILMMENVPMVISKKNLPVFEDWLRFLTSIGYSNFYQCMQAKDFGVPQSRNRCFMISILNTDKTYAFPKTIPLTKCVKDLLKSDVDEKYYINNEKADLLIRQLIDSGAIKKTGLYLTNEKTVRVKQATKQGYIDCKIGGVADLSYPYSNTRRGRVQDNGDTSPTITATETGVCVIEDASKVYYRIRKLTPIECGRLMDVSDEDIAKIKAIGISDSQMYKLFGNSIVVGVMCHLFSQML